MSVVAKRLDGHRPGKITATNLDEHAKNCETLSFISGSADTVINAVVMHKMHLKQQQRKCVESRIINAI